ncbi:CMD domain protein [Arthrobacter sp. LFS091]|jgi:CMD domain protein|uniref:CMD domain protein n=1 Tax=Arthrobacter sp. LFS091 TaxID=3229892 RepID=UPI003A803DCE
MSNTFTDAVDDILGVIPGSPLDELRRRRPITRDNTQASYLALFHSGQLDDAGATERYAVALFVALVHENHAAAAFYASGLVQAGADAALTAAVREAAHSAATEGPYGKYREPGLQGENTAGLQWIAGQELRDTLSPRLAAALEHAHLLVFRPREASPAALQALLSAGWTTTGIVTLSQLVAFLSYQLRIITGLELLNVPSSAEEAERVEVQNERIYS